MNNRTLPSRPYLDHYKKLAKTFVKAWKSGNPLAVQWEGKEAIVWNAKERLVDGEKLPDVEMRIVHQAPEPEPEAAAADATEPAAQ